MVSRQLSRAAKRDQPPIINGGQTWSAANASRARCMPACRPGLSRPPAHPARVLFGGDELLDGAVRSRRAMVSCPDDNLEVWPVAGSAVTSGTNGHSQEALGIGKGASSTRGSAAWQRHLKAKHARVVLGALRSPALRSPRLMIFLLCGIARDGSARSRERGRRPECGCATR